MRPLYASLKNVASVNGTALYSAAACKKRKEWLSVSRVAVLEGPFETMNRLIGKSSEWLWVASIREPRSWFYSAVGHQCSNFGRDPGAVGFIPGCSQTATIDTLVANRWFEPTKEGVTHIHYYFHHPDVQSRMLSGFFARPNWLLCDISQLSALLDVVASAVGASLSLQRDNSAIWQFASNFKRRVPWSHVRYNYMVDEALHTSVMQGSGCIGHTMSSVIRGTLSQLILAHGTNVSWVSSVSS